MKLPPDHLALLRQHDFAVPTDVGINDADRLLLLRYGRWMEALAAGRIMPLTPDQEHFLAVCRGRDKPTSDFERAWMAYTQSQNRSAEAPSAAPVELSSRLAQLAEARRFAAEVRAEYDRRREEILAQVREQLDPLEAEFAEQQGSADEVVQRLEAEVRRLVLETGLSARHTTVEAQYVQGRATWDTQGLAKYAETHPDLLQFRKVTVPTVRVLYRE